MAEVTNLVPPAYVQYEGEALRVLVKLAEGLQRFTKLHNSVPPEMRDKFKEIWDLLEDITNVMRAVQNTYDEIQAKADRLLEMIEDEEEKGFVNRGSSQYYVAGKLHRRSRTLSITDIGARAAAGAGLPAELSSNVVLFPAIHFDTAMQPQRRSESA